LPGASFLLGAAAEIGNSSSMRVVVFGANGFLGEHIVAMLSSDSRHQVRAVTRRGTEIPFDRQRVEVVQGEIRDADFVGQALTDQDAVVYAAGRTWQPGLDMQEYRRQNLGLTRALLEAAQSRPDLRIVFTSSLATVAGSRSPYVFDEESGRQRVCESRLTPYDRAKIESEQLVLAHARRGGQVIVLNPGLILGPGVSPASKINNPVILLWVCQGRCPFFVDAAIAFCDVRDVARAHVAALHVGGSGDRYILTGHNLKRSAFYNRLAQLTGVRPPRPVPCALATGFTAMGDAIRSLTDGRWQGPFHRQFVRAQGLHYCGNSGKAARVLGYQVTPLERTIWDTLRDAWQRDLLSPELDFLAWAAPEQAAAVLCLRQLMCRHPFARFLLPRLETVFQICRQNHALRQAMEGLLAKGTFRPRRARWQFPAATCRRELQALSGMMDYLYFASDEFLAGVL
jgi:dihydroflavonol-4-reductase